MTPNLQSGIVSILHAHFKLVRGREHKRPHIHMLYLVEKRFVGRSRCRTYAYAAYTHAHCWDTEKYFKITTSSYYDDGHLVLTLYETVVAAGQFASWIRRPMEFYAYDGCVEHFSDPAVVPSQKLATVSLVVAWLCRTWRVNVRVQMQTHVKYGLENDLVGQVRCCAHATWSHKCFSVRVFTQKPNTCRNFQVSRFSKCSDSFPHWQRDAQNNALRLWLCNRPCQPLFCNDSRPFQEM